MQQFLVLSPRGLLGHAGLFLITEGTLVSLAYQTVESENLRLYTQISLGIAFALAWMLLGAVRTLHQDFAFSLSASSIFFASQIAFVRDFPGYTFECHLGLW